jgi:hypothetical protein
MDDLNFPNAILDERDFFGRLDLLNEIRRTFLQRKRVPILVIGERRIGKTSLQNIAIQQLLASEQGDFRVLNIEPRGITSYAQFIQAVMRQLTSWMRTCANPGAALPKMVDSNEDFEFVLSDILESQKKELIICIDEFDEIVRGLGEELPALIGMFYYLIERTRLPIHFFFTMTHIPHQMEEEVPSSLVSMSQIFMLSPLSFTEMKKLSLGLTGGALDWPDEALEELFRLSGGHPYFTKLILSCLLALCPPGSAALQVTPELLRRAVFSAVHDPKADHVMKNLYKVHFSTDEKELLLFMAQHNGPISVSELQKAGKHWVTQARLLKGRHYLKMDVEGNCFEFSIAFLGEWLKNWIEFDLECEEFGKLLKILSRPEIEVDDAVKMVRFSGQEIRLSTQEYKIMRCLAQNAEKLVTRSELIAAAWETLDGVTDQTIDTAVYRIRKKLNDPGNFIETKTGQGFILHQAILINTKKDT